MADSNRQILCVGPILGFYKIPNNGNISMRLCFHRVISLMCYLRDNQTSPLTYLYRNTNK